MGTRGGSKRGSKRGSKKCKQAFYEVEMFKRKRCGARGARRGVASSQPFLKMHRFAVRSAAAADARRDNKSYYLFVVSGRRTTNLTSSTAATDHTCTNAWAHKSLHFAFFSEF